MHHPPIISLIWNSVAKNSQLWYGGMQTLEVSDSQSNIQIVEIAAPVLFTVHVSERVNEAFFSLLVK